MQCGLSSTIKTSVDTGILHKDNSNVRISISTCSTHCFLTVACQLFFVLLNIGKQNQISPKNTELKLNKISLDYPNSYISIESGFWNTHALKWSALNTDEERMHLRALLWGRWLCLYISYLYPRPTKLEGGGGGILDSPCPSVRPSVRLSVDDMVSGA